MENIRIKYFTDRIDKLEYIDGKSDWIDLRASRDTVVNFNDRICQFRIMQNQPQIVFQEVNALGNSNRGGFGSTGKQ